MAQIEHFVLGIMTAEPVRFDQGNPDNTTGRIASDPGLARARAVAHQCIKRLLTFERFDEQRDLRRQMQQQRVNLAGIVEPCRAIGNVAHVTSVRATLYNSLSICGLRDSPRKRLRLSGSATASPPRLDETAQYLGDAPGLRDAAAR